MTTEFSIEPFRGDAEALERMARTAWRDEYGRESYPNLYRPDYLAYLMAGVDDPRLAIAAYRGDEIMGFLLNLPRTMALDNAEYRAALSCLMVTRKELMRTGLAQAMIQEGLRINQELEFDFTLFYLETGHRSSRLFKKLRAAGAPVEKVKTMHTIARILDLEAVRRSEKLRWFEFAAVKALGLARPPRKDPDSRVREALPDDADAILELMNDHRGKLRLARVFTRQELIRELIHPPLARTLVFEKRGRLRAALAYVMIDHAGKTTAPWAWINHLAWDQLSLAERKSLLNSFLVEAEKRGAAGVVEWSKKTYPTFALYASRFAPYPRRVDMMAWRFREDISLSGISGVYEIQL